MNKQAINNLETLFFLNLIVLLTVSELSLLFLAQKLMKQPKKQRIENQAKRTYEASKTDRGRVPWLACIHARAHSLTGPLVC